MNQSGWSLQKFKLRTIYIHRFYTTVGCHTDPLTRSNLILNKHNDDGFCLLWNLMAFLQPARDNRHRLSNKNKQENINEIKWPDPQRGTALGSPYGFANTVPR